MTINSELIAISFRLINFLIIIFLIIYSFKKYALPPIEKGINDEHRHLEELKAHATKLQGDKKSLEEGIKEDARSCEMLKDKMAKWLIGAQKESEAFQAEHAKRVEQVKERTKQQAQAIEFYRRRQIIVPAALKKARVLLEDEFAHKDRGYKYIQQVVVSMEESG